ncbi:MULTISPECIES: thioredoxin [Deinococcus]|uniref:Thioredoxin n=1 Tax=Deinococcus rufus TaxID=2136097 RepID=A0ABV7Z4J9_9DEIO|nr:thioredoxin [Deinococcus sp. AB2017081]WQE94805.1 thioredoxin [Deinococcus sp. AB2017081]
MKPVELSDSTFTSEISEGLTLVDFWAPWCGPCRIIAPVIEEIAGQYEGRVKVAKLNVDDNPVTQGQFRVMSIPTLILFKDGQPVEGVVGAQPKRAFEALLDKYAAPAPVTAGTESVSVN